MSRLVAYAKKVARREEGATMVEYGLMLALIAVVCILVVTALGLATQATFQSVVSAL
jgi:pilus assembly protein Flp/PilA